MARENTSGEPAPHDVDTTHTGPLMVRHGVEDRALVAAHVRSALGEAREHVDYAARQFTHAVAEGLEVTPRVRAVGAEIYDVSGALAGLARELQTIEHVLRVEGGPDGDPDLMPDLAWFTDIAHTSRALRERADRARRTLPRRYGDPTGLERDYPTP